VVLHMVVLHMVLLHVCMHMTLRGWPAASIHQQQQQQQQQQQYCALSHPAWQQLSPASAACRWC
jgi:hypothetical protein